MSPGRGSYRGVSADGSKAVGRPRRVPAPVEIESVLPVAEEALDMQQAMNTGHACRRERSVLSLVFGLPVPAP
jgi:hypothetical protein